MTRVIDTVEEFADDAIDGLVAAYGRYVRRVDGGVVRSTATTPGRVAVVIGGGSGHYPAFAGIVGPGLATGAVCGNVFTSPSAGQAYRVAKAADSGGGVLFSFGNYAGDVLHFGLAAERLAGDGIDVRTVLVTDDIASAPAEEQAKRRGIAGDFAVFKIAGASADRGDSLDEVERLARLANARTRTLGVAFSGCTLPGATEPLFTVPDGQMSVGLGIHGEPGIRDVPLATASDLASTLVKALLAERPDGADGRVAVLVNGLGSVSYEELFVVFGAAGRLLRDAGLDLVEPECGELVTSLDMGGLSLTLVWLDDELEPLWRAAAATPAYRKGALEMGQATAELVGEVAEDAGFTAETATLARLAPAVLEAAGLVRAALVEHQEELGRIDAIAGDGDHGIGMARGIAAADDAARSAVESGAGAHAALTAAADAWSERAGGTSGALWAAAISAAAGALRDGGGGNADAVVSAVEAGLAAVQRLGKAEVGDKTMVDAFEPFAAELRARHDGGTSLSDSWSFAVDVARRAAHETASLAPRLGRARPLAERSIGHPDAGAISFGYIVEALSHMEVDA
ncbi:dihydroxyacetone kinase family protein [Microbacterium sp. SA39]|uniref:dihydroxyacetone kinase family protein n=1 Tax=Microbacterium sp. SA39 TaxID=1263625 RepID=UPI0005FA4EAC|nr:dihydroxyacetone kinase family protein [Microbacterium sp. SA39]KJQ53882.1 PTS-dependent dihydroxyacetone kinase, dihydroxyacetone-binding subunit DhaK [Microbacterium sp. SA39]